MPSNPSPSPLHPDLGSATTTRLLTELRVGERGRLSSAELPDGDLELLRALGFVDRSPFRLCQAGNPWIVQIRGTRIGISDDVARQLRVVLEPSEISGLAKAETR